MEHKGNSFLQKVNTPDDLKKIDEKDLPILCQELRDFIIDAVSCNPAHFGASLGVIELTVALHYVFNTPYDKLIWDVGHQAYGHKILTGRKDRFHTNRKYKGISGFPNIFESEYDAFGVGHSSTSISAALGIAMAAKLNKEFDRQTVAIIGDGSMTAGQAFEGLNNLSSSKANMLIILNDNNMAIDPNVGGLSEYLVDISTSHTYNKIRNELIKGLEKLKITGPNAKDKITAINNSIKSLLTKQTNIFEGLNIRYFGPVDGHDINHLIKVLNDLKIIPGPKVLHCITKKGKGFKYAEENQTAWHATGTKFDKVTGEKLEVPTSKPKPPKYQEVFGNTIVELAEKNDKIVGITPAMPTGCSLNIMMEKMPDRAFDVGIAEQHAVTFSAGMAISGLVPFCNIYSSFMQRAYDQVIHDVAIQKLNVVFCLDRGGLVGADGATHHGVYDLAFFRLIPNLIIASPRNEHLLRNLMFTAQLPNQGPFVIRYPRGIGTTTEWQNPMQQIEIGKGELILDGEDIAILTLGPVCNKALQVCQKLKDENIYAALYDLRFCKPIDEDLLHQVFSKHKKVITIEDGTIIGGIGSAVTEFMVENNYNATIKKLGVPDKFIDHGTQTELQHECGFDKEGIYEAAKSLISE
ncbi:1-deoxy-D-xylulose-5-phosphate synthase [Plebeiibacterium sediminum]|uniref:1-deoxy-D-xylulose-5-phosphate synthase n=1 Tax=Plebeiibacterium sediminum TaxID=2992112 RepID=A0AAE3M2A9_9BACT|nr:1-deoxy-D-xylulose-5-phosphate synthase [Plebeiobacterium sediminum]MCW3785813.1 1-deoxy-D-xylulose-5-phosphate synthase [Plebeiobacterium sediminum]